MELRHLRYFVAVAEGLSYRRAAERLRVAQPALSKQIKDLEHEVGAKLFDRNTAGVALTDAGALFLEETRDILRRLNEAMALARDAEAGRRGRLVIGGFGAFSSGFLPTALAAFRKHYPEVDVMVHELGLPDQLGALKTGALQVEFTIEPERTIPKELERARILSASVAAIMSSDHRLARQSKVSLRDLATDQFFCIGETERHDLHRERIHALLTARGVKHRPIKRVNSFESLVALVAGGHGVSIMLPLGRSRSVEDIVYRRIKEDGADLGIEVFAVWRKAGGSSLAHNFVKTLREMPVKAR
jgi:DNA-binding transcriptional LysR family regulator